METSTARSRSSQESAAVYRKLGDERGLGVVLSNLGYRLIVQGEHEQARLLCEEALSLFVKRGERGSMPLPLINLGLTAFLQERYGEALAYYRQGLRLSDELGNVVLRIYCLDGLAAVLAASGDADGATTVVAAAQAAAESTGASLEPFEQQIHEQTVEAAKQALGEESFAAAWTGGWRLTIDEAVARALEIDEPAPSQVTSL